MNCPVLLCLLHQSSGIYTETTYSVPLTMLVQRVTKIDKGGFLPWNATYPPKGHSIRFNIITLRTMSLLECLPELILETVFEESPSEVVHRSKNQHLYCLCSSLPRLHYHLLGAGDLSWWVFPISLRNMMMSVTIFLEPSLMCEYPSFQSQASTPLPSCVLLASSLNSHITVT